MRLTKNEELNERIRKNTTVQKMTVAELVKIVSIDFLLENVNEPSLDQLAIAIENDEPIMVQTTFGEIVALWLDQEFVD
jgi:hypothetical protein